MDIAQPVVKAKASATSSSKVVHFAPLPKAQPPDERPNPIEYKISAKWKGDDLSMDELLDHFEQFGKCDPLDWLNEGSLNRVPVLFTNIRDMEAALEAPIHNVISNRGKKISVTVLRGVGEV